MTPPDRELTAETLHGFGRWLALAPEWEALCDAAERPLPTLRHGWIRAGRELRRRSPGRLLTVLVREHGRPVMAGLFELGFRGLGPMLRVPYAGLPQLDDIVWIPSRQTSRQARLLLETLRRELWLPRFFRSSTLRADSPLIEAAAAMGLDCRSRRSHTNYVVPLPQYSGFPSYLKSLGKNLRLDHGRRLRRIHETGHFVLERGQSPAALDWLLEQKLAWLDRTGKSAEWLTSGYTRRFLHRALLTPGAQKWSIWTATLDGRPFAATLCLEEPRLWYPIMVTHDPAMDHLSPGRTLNLLLVEQAFAAGVERVEFGITDSQWKDRLAAGHEAVVRQRIRIR